MITRDYRPSTFDEVAGQELNIRILKSIVENPERAPRSLIFQGGFGTGKTSLSRIFARALNCESKTHKPCGKCQSCREDIDTAPYYAEFDSAAMGSVERIRELRDTFSYSIVNGWSVKVLDECHTISPQGQSALLKVIEEAPPRVFFIFATTNVEKVLRTIRSRSLELRFDLIPSKDIINNLRIVATKEGIDVPDDILDLIAKKSGGHMRNAHMYLDKYLMIGDTDFRQSVRSAHASFYKYFISIAKKDKQGCCRAIDEILTFPLAELQDDYQEVVSEIARSMVGMNDGQALEIVHMLKSETLKVVKASIADWVTSSFNSDVNLQTALLCLFQMLCQSITNGSASTQGSSATPYGRAMARRG